MINHFERIANPDHLRNLAHRAMLDYSIDASLANEMRTALRDGADWIERQSKALQAAQEYQIGSEVTDAINEALTRDGWEAS